MTEPDEALLWAREVFAAGLKRETDLAALREGSYDQLINPLAEPYRAGAAASAERIKELEARVGVLVRQINTLIVPLVGEPDQ